MVKEGEGSPKMQWQDNIVEWTSLGLEEAMLITTNREGWKKINCSPMVSK